MSNETTIFLGAGASVPFSIPDSKKLARSVERDLHKNHRSRLREIRLNVKKFRFRYDIEALLSILEFWSNPRKVILETGPFFAETTKFDRRHFRRKPKDALIALRIKEYIVRKCFINDPQIIEKIYQIYGQFFEQIVEKFDPRLCDPGGILRCPTLDLFTTNYDNVIEEYCRKNGIRLYDGFRELYRGHHIFDPDYYEKAVGYLRLYKLHGTVTYARLKTSQLERVSFIPGRGKLIISGAEAFPDLIYPGTHLYLAREPQLELLYLLKKRLLSSRTCIVVGCSFEDPNIRQIFDDACRRNTSLKIFLVAPGAQKTVDDKKLNPNQIIPISKRFQDLSVQDDIR